MGDRRSLDVAMPKRKFRIKPRFFLFLLISIVFALSWWISTGSTTNEKAKSTKFSGWFPHHPRVRRPANAADIIARCRNLNVQAGPSEDFHHRTQSDRFEAGTKPVLVKNARIWTGSDNGTQIIRGDILLEKGIIQRIGHLQTQYRPNELVVVDAKGGWVTPGIVDVHSHMGVGASPSLSGADDGNSIHGITQPWLRSLDGLNTHDDAYLLSIAGGVTTSLILPGSANAIGGQAFVMKLRPTSEKSSSSMLLEPPLNINTSFPDTNSPVRWRHIKHACGENPSRVYQGTRMDTIWSFRKAYDTAAKIKAKQDAFCDRVSANEWEGLGDFPEDLQWEALVDVLRGRVKVNTHCYEAVDLDAFVRLTNEFKFPVAAFHHASETYLVPDVLKKAYGKTPAVAIFAAFSRYKREAYRSSHFAARISAESGITVLMKSDHPAINSRYLIHEAQQAHYFGLAENLAIASVTSNAADVMGMGHRIGYIKEGYDADLVIWDSHPLALGATPTQVFIDGIPQLSPSAPRHTPKDVEAQEPPRVPDFGNEAKLTVDYDGLPPLHPKGELSLETTIVFKNVSSLYQRRSGKVYEVFAKQSMSTNGELGLTVVIQKGNVRCYGEDRICGRSIHDEEDARVEYVDLKGGSISPGLMTYGSAMGLGDIDMEASTSDGYIFDPLLDGDLPAILGGHGSSPTLIRAVDGLQLGSRDALLAYRAGVTLGVSAPVRGVGASFLTGLSTTFSLGVQHKLQRGAVIQSAAALHFSIGHVPIPGWPSVSTQVAVLRKLLLHACTRIRLGADELDQREEEDESLLHHLITVAKGAIPLVVETHNADIIATLLVLKQEVEEEGGQKIRLTIVGGSEAHILAKELAEARVGVILNPPRPFPTAWEGRRILPGPPLTQESAVSTLATNGVIVGLGTHTPFGRWSAKLLPWDLGWAQLEASSVLTAADALSMGSTNLETLLGVEIGDDEGDLVATQGGELMSFEGKPVLVVSPRQGTIHLL